MSKAWSEDLKRYGGYKAFLREHSIYCVALFRFGKYVDSLNSNILKFIFLKIYYFLYFFVVLFFKMSIPKEACIGPGLRIWHLGQVFINPNTIIGKNCTLRHGVTIGSKDDSQLSPVIGDNVDFGVSSIAIGNINIGSNVTIGALTLVRNDVPDNSTIVGVPGRVISTKAYIS
ncbi:serine acetyltransferase [Shewanella frigidimarina]|uniref:serine acetyltransferase n=1 Tax=Shewanella frigidimarina TaxID=56812 RepID=UPI003FA187DA